MEKSWTSSFHGWSIVLQPENEEQIDALVNTVQIFSEDIRMEFGISKCTTLIMKRGIILRNEII